MTKVRTIGLWIAVIAAFVAMQFVAGFVSSLVGVPTILDVDPFTVQYGRGAESEVSSITTTFGWGFNILSVLSGVCVWYLIKGKRGSREDEGFFAAWLVGAVILVIGGIPIWKLISAGGAIFITRLMELCLIVVAWYLGYRIWQSSKQPL